MKRVVGLLTVASFAFAPTAAPAQPSARCVGAPATEAVRYRERPEGGSARDTGRVLRPAGSAAYGIDIDSRVDIVVDVSCLRHALSPRALASEGSARVVALSIRIAHLSAAAAQIDAVMKLLAEAQAAHASAAQSRDFREADRRIAQFADAMLAVFTSLKHALEQRLVQQRIPRARAAVLDSAARAREVKPLVDAVMNPILEHGGYDVAALRNAFAREITAAEAELQTLPDPVLAIEIQAHLVNHKGDAIPIALPRYNDAATGPETRFDRLQLGVTPAQLELHARYDSLARNVKAAQSLGDALLTALRADWDRARPDVDRLLARLRMAVGNSKPAYQALPTWANVDKRNAWLASVRSDLQASPQLAARWRRVTVMLDDLTEDVEALRAIAEVRGVIAARNGEEALNVILVALSGIQSLTLQERASGRMLRLADWRARADTLRAFVQTVGELQPAVKGRFMDADGPVRDLMGLAAAAESIRRALETTTDEARVWLGRAIGGDVARTIASLPVPAGQQRVALTDDASTSLNLRTIPAPRAEGDVVQVSYTFYADERRLSDGWRDELRLRAFGLLGRAVAGLAFARPQSNNQWSPTASLSWIATYRRWPKPGSSGLGTNMRAIGLGLSTMSLNFEPDERVQIGLAGTLSLIDDRILAGWGHNLQAKSGPNFWFFSLRLFSTSGSLGGN